jgi:hypothetical protein
MKNATVVRAARIALSAGVGFYIAAMFLPAVRLPYKVFMFLLPIENIWGIFCAVATTIGALQDILAQSGLHMSEPLKGLTTLVAATVNPLILIYVVLYMRKARPLTLTLMAIAILWGYASIEISLHGAKCRMLAGYYVWTAGIALIVISPFIERIPTMIAWFRDRYGTGPT